MKQKERFDEKPKQEHTEPNFSIAVTAAHTRKTERI